MSQQKLQGFVSEITINPSSGSSPSQALQNILPAASSQPGFQGSMHLTDPQSGRTKVVLRWEDEQAYQQAKQSAGYQAAISKVGQEQTFEVTSASGSMSSSQSGSNPTQPRA